MAVPKRRQSSARRDSRRAQWMKVAPAASSPCPNCGASRLPHRMCEACGWYGSAKEGRVVVAPKQKAQPEGTASEST
ncbi:MAG TPA: 50S ribosomal protein L32 [Pseudomonadota bacterium]|jgi:large subunit ribosomal protein L32|nr:50S ribosomal protein L32 [Pseudomonadota bacterium]